MKSRPSVTAIALLMIGAGTLILPFVFGRASADSDTSSRLQELLTQRREILERAVDMRMAQYREGVCAMEDVLAVRRDLQEAALDEAKTREERIAVLKQQLKTAESSVAIAEQMFRAARASQVNVLQAQAARLHVEIRLLRERESASSQDE